MNPLRPSKRLIVCCDGTWMNALGKASQTEPPSNVSRLVRVVRNTATTATTGEDGRMHTIPQVVLYHPGVGSSGRLLDASMGGAFGLGLDADIRELYDFVCLNYSDGDHIVLVGFSRGAFTARSVADLIASVGLLTPEGLDRFYDIFADYEHMGDKHRDPDRFLCPSLEPYRGQDGDEWIRWEDRRMQQYRDWLKENRYTRFEMETGSGAGSAATTATETGTANATATANTTTPKQPITIRALAVWDTVGSLGIPALPVIGLQGSARQWKFTNTHISPKVEYAFQALALDEPRYAFLPALWERLPDNHTTQLKQVWFPGAHGSIGGGDHDQQMADITLAWMCDQLTAVGVEFDPQRMETLFRDGLRFSAAHPFPYIANSKTSTPLSTLSTLWQRRARPPNPWAKAPFWAANQAAAYASSSDNNDNMPEATLHRDSADCPGKYVHYHADAPLPHLWKVARPWAMGQLRSPTSLLQMAAGTIVRQPGRFVRVDAETNEPLPSQPLQNTEERVHASVRVRLACGGLSLDDRRPWRCAGLTGHLEEEDDDDLDVALPEWRLERLDQGPSNSGPTAAAAGTDDPFEEDDQLYPLHRVYSTGRWQWKLVKPGGGNRHHHRRQYSDPDLDPDADHDPESDHDKNNDSHLVDRKLYETPLPDHPVITVLPEELPTGRWERLLLAMTVGNPDVLEWAAAKPFVPLAY